MLGLEGPVCIVNIPTFHTHPKNTGLESSLSDVNGVRPGVTSCAATVSSKSPVTHKNSLFKRHRTPCYFFLTVFPCHLRLHLWMSWPEDHLPAVYIAFFLCTQILPGHSEEGNGGQKVHVALDSLHLWMVLTSPVSVHLINSADELEALASPSTWHEPSFVLKTWKHLNPNSQCDYIWYRTLMQS